MTCRRCKHPLQSHNEGSCRMKIATGWDEAGQTFTGERHCECASYDGPQPSAEIIAGCPHERQPQGPTPDRCVHCGTTVVVRNE